MTEQSPRRRSSILSDAAQMGLDKHLANRSAPAAAAQGQVAPALVSKRKQLEAAITRDKVGQALSERPDTSDLLKSNIIKGQASSRLQATQRALERRMTENKVGQLLENRADVDELQHSNIIKDNSVAAALQGPQRTLQRNLVKSNLFHALKSRPSIVELQQRGVYVPSQQEDEYETQQQQQQQRDYEPSYQRRSKNFHLTRILLKMVANMAEAGEITLQQKGSLKDLIVDQDRTILAVAESYDAENDLNELKESLIVLASRR